MVDTIKNLEESAFILGMVGVMGTLSVAYMLIFTIALAG